MKQPAFLTNLAGAYLPPVVLSVSSQYQFCVDAGALAAVCFFDDLNGVGLHDHIACSMEIFTSTVQQSVVALEAHFPGTLEACTDAFAAGYLGRIQQELRLFHGERGRRNQAAIDASMFMQSHTQH